MSQLLSPTKNVDSLFNVNSLAAGSYTISGATTGKPTGMLEAGILVLFKRSTASVGLAITYNSATTAVKINIVGNNVWS